jgi:acetyl-CoA acetyltransferase
MRPVAIVSFAQSIPVAHTLDGTVELLLPVVTAALEQSGLERRDIGFWCHGSCDYLTGQPFSFVAAVDAIGAWPPVVESHVEADGAFALYEAWVKIQTGEVDTALVFGNGKSSAADTRRSLALQHDPYYVAPLWADAHGIAGLQARAALDAGVISEYAIADAVARSHRDARANPFAMRRDGSSDVGDLRSQPATWSPLRPHDLPTVADAAAAVVICTLDIAKRICARPAVIRGIDHRSDIQHLGLRNLAEVPSATIAAAKAGATGRFDVAELHSPYAHEELLLARAIGLDAGRINPSGGALCSNPIMASGLIRFGEAASHIWNGSADRVLAHTTSGPALQQNLFCVIEGDG